MLSLEDAKRALDHLNQYRYRRLHDIAVADSEERHRDLGFIRSDVADLAKAIAALEDEKLAILRSMTFNTGDE